MAAIDFPNNPTVGQVFSTDERSWVWSGTTWDSVGSSGGGVTPPTPTGPSESFHPFLLMGV